MTAIEAAIGYFALVFVCGFVLGTLRVLVVTPTFGELGSVLLELPLMLTVSWYACRLVLAHRPVAPTPGSRIAMGTIAFGLLMTAELALSRLGFGRTITQHLANYGNMPELLGLAGQIAFASIPTIQIGR